MKTDLETGNTILYKKIDPYTYMYKPQVTDDTVAWWLYVFENGFLLEKTLHSSKESADNHLAIRWTTET